MPCDWHLAVRSLQLLTNARVTEIYRRSYLKGDKMTIPLEKAQTELVEEALKMEAQYILFIEDDTIPPPGTIPELTRMLDSSDSNTIMSCGGIYTTRNNPPEPIVYLAPGAGPFWNWKIGDVFECWACGMGCQMIRMDLFKKMPKPWFREINSREEVMEFPDLWPEALDESLQEVRVTTDMFFFTKLASMGMKALAHGGVLPVHWDMPTNRGYWLPKNSYPVQGLKIDGKEYGWTDPDMEVTDSLPIKNTTPPVSASSNGKEVNWTVT